jgi:hypothetical protein
MSRQEPSNTLTCLEETLETLLLINEGLPSASQAVLEDDGVNRILAPEVRGWLLLRD